VWKVGDPSGIRQIGAAESCGRVGKTMRGCLILSQPYLHSICGTDSASYPPERMLRPHTARAAGGRLRCGPDTAPAFGRGAPHCR